MRLYPFKKSFSPFWRWALFLVFLPILELFLLLNFFVWGQWVTLSSMLVSGLLGIFLARREGLRHWIELNKQLDRGETPTLPVLHGIVILLAALLMILPGLLTSLFGLFLLFPLSRAFVVSYLVLRFESYRHQTRQSNTPSSPEIIDV
ncbi:MAG: FxsA family protein [Planctomycetaceae bacterium]|jgi:UPF0716 protein FxsA|nr:FxsA family protein [Planctomycetaceae bacterium]